MRELVLLDEYPDGIPDSIDASSQGWCIHCGESSIMWDPEAQEACLVACPPDGHWIVIRCSDCGCTWEEHPRNGIRGIRLKGTQ